jgi:hypothetical protein
MQRVIKNEREVNPIYFPSQRVLGVNLNYFFFLAAFFAVFFADFFAAFFAVFAIAFLFFIVKRYEKL